MMQQELPNLVDERRFKRREPEQFERDEFGRRKWPEEKIPIDLEPIPGFNLRAQVVGSGGAYVKHIQGETRCRVQIKGRGSGFKDPATGQEHDEPMYLHVAGPDPDMVKRAKELCLDLLENVKQEYEKFKERGAQNRGYGGGGGGYGDRNDRGGYNNGYNGQHSHQSGYGAQSPTAHAPDGATPTSATDYASADYAAQYAQYYGQGGADPYAAYGGYNNYVAMYYQYYQQQAGTSESPAPGAGSPTNPTAVPPPPTTEAPPPPPGGAAPPPPPPGAPPSSYSSV